MAPKPAGKTLAKPKAGKAVFPKPWPPKVPLGSMKDVLPLIKADDESLDTLMLPSPGMLGDGAQGVDFGPDDIQYLCQCLEKNKTVTHLNVSMSPIGDVGAAHIAALLEKGQPILRLSMNGCGISSLGAQSLAKGLAQSEVMVVELTSNRIDDVGGRALLDAVQQNKRLQDVQLGFNSISPEMEAEMEKVFMLR
ncbi:Nod1 [Symbiodinium pilosum]|uniref:Nod1 protein n=1 Tax=Symbiodinium pilosum TaxID=2952 RepID=A0A812S1K1_SYMPI|nr:Nod1 [Symbiodinium pilosum]